MAARRAWLGIAAIVIAPAGCTTEEEPFPVACTASAAELEQALEAAPAPVTLADSTRVSTCVRRARDSAELQTLGTTLTAVADKLELTAARDPGHALRLGYLIGAVRAGAARTEGVALELARRLEQTATPADAPDAVASALARGLRAGEATG